jgi:hypothetical protein
VTIGSSVLLIVVGAILKWAVTADASWINIQACGIVLLIAGVAGFLLNVLFAVWRSRPERAKPQRAGTPPRSW